MREVSFSELYTKNFDVSMLVAFNQKWADGQEFYMTKPRKCSALLYFDNCCGKYIFPDNTTFSVKKGDVVYIPKDSVYKTVFYAQEGGVCTTRLIEFEIKDNDGVFVISNEVFVAVENSGMRITEIFKESADIFAMPVFHISAFKAELYSLISIISEKYRYSEPNSKEYKSILPAIKYLENNTEIDKTVEELAEMCYMSGTYFRSLFKKCMGASPSDYCTRLKVSNAKRLLKSGFYSVDEVAEQLGFKDSGYFNKVFKKYTGVTPGKYK